MVEIGSDLDMLTGREIFSKYIASKDQNITEGNTEKQNLFLWRPIKNAGKPER